MHQAPISEVLVHVNKALQDELVTDSGLKLYLDGSYSKEYSASVTGTVKGLPINPHYRNKEVVSRLKEGDEICFSYRVVADFEFKGDGGQFMSTVEENPYVKEFINGKGETIKAYALPKRSGLIGSIWVGVYCDKYKNFIDGVQGDESELERWLAQFPFGKTDIYNFNNLFSYNGEDYWKCLPTDIFAKKVKGHLVAVGNRIICKPCDEELPDQYLIDTHGVSQKITVRRRDRARVMSGGKAKGFKKDQVISFQPNHCERYEFYGTQYFLINENLVDGIWQEV